MPRARRAVAVSALALALLLSAVGVLALLLNGFFGEVGDTAENAEAIGADRWEVVVLWSLSLAGALGAFAAVREAFLALGEPRGLQRYAVLAASAATADAAWVAFASQVSG